MKPGHFQASTLLPGRYSKRTLPSWLFVSLYSAGGVVMSMQLLYADHEKANVQAWRQCHERTKHPAACVHVLSMSDL